MRILTIGINYLPEQTGIGPYTAALSAHLVKQGHQVDVLTGLPSYPEWRVHQQYRRTLWRTEMLEGVNVHRRWHYVPRTQSAMRRLAYETSFLLSGLSLLRFPRPDLIVGVIPTLSGGLLARIASGWFHVPYALIFQDLMGPAAAQTGVSGASRVAALVRSAERTVSLNAVAIGIIAEGFRSYLESLGVESRSIHRVRNWTRIDKPNENPADTRRSLGVDDNDVVCLHAGNMGYKQGLGNIVECARLALLTQPKLRFILMGDGNQRSEIEQLGLKLGLTNLTFMPLQPDGAFANILSAADVLLLNQRAGVSDMSLPSKITAYLAAGRPVVAAVDSESESARELREADAGIIVEPDDPSALLEALATLATDSGERERLGHNGRDQACRALSAEAALASFEQLFTNAGAMLTS